MSQTSQTKPKIPRKSLTVGLLTSVAAILLAAVALQPVLGEFAVALERYLSLVDLYKLSQQVELQQGERRAQAKNYQTFLTEMEQLSTRLGEFRIRPDQWNEYKVDIRERLVDVNTMNTMLDHARNGFDYYFEPKHFEMNANLPQDEKGAMPKALQEQLKKEKVEAGSRVLLSLEGKFVVAAGQ